MRPCCNVFLFCRISLAFIFCCFCFYVSLHSTAMRVSSFVCVCVCAYFVIYATPTLTHTRTHTRSTVNSCCCCPRLRSFCCAENYSKRQLMFACVCVCVLDICFVDNMCYCYCYCCCCCWYSIGKFQTHSTATTHMFKFPACTTMTTLCSSPSYFPSIYISLYALSVSPPLSCPLPNRPTPQPKHRLVFVVVVVFSVALQMLNTSSSGSAHI